MYVEDRLLEMSDEELVAEVLKSEEPVPFTPIVRKSSKPSGNQEILELRSRVLRLEQVVKALQGKVLNTQKKRSWFGVGKR